jgi:hypothetical protein
MQLFSIAGRKVDKVRINESATDELDERIRQCAFWGRQESIQDRIKMKGKLFEGQCSAHHIRASKSTHLFAFLARALAGDDLGPFLCYMEFLLGREKRQSSVQEV